MKKRFEELFDRILNYAGLALVGLGLAVVFTVVAIVIIVNVLKALALIAIGLCLTGAIAMILYGMFEHVKEAVKGEDN